MLLLPYSLTEGIGISREEGVGGGSSARPENLKKCMKLNWNVGIRKNLFHGGGMYT